MFSSHYSESRKPITVVTKKVIIKKAKQPVSRVGTSSCPVPSPRPQKPLVQAIPRVLKRSASPLPRKRSQIARRRPTLEQHLSSSSDEGSQSESSSVSRKKVKRCETAKPLDPMRRLRSALAFNESKSEFEMIHAADIPGLDKSTKYKPIFQGLNEGTIVSLQYPSASRQEK